MFRKAWRWVKGKIARGIQHCIRAYFRKRAVSRMTLGPGFDQPGTIVRSYFKGEDLVLVWMPLGGRVGDTQTIGIHELIRVGKDWFF